jgi:hypothetical protein
MLDRLPPVYGIQSGTLLNSLIALVANHQAAYDEDMQRVQRSHWLDTAFDREDLGKLGALFDLAMLPWEPDYLYRTRLKATVAARLAGVQTIDLLKVRQEGDGLVVVLITGQKYRFDPGQIASAIQNHLDNLTTGLETLVRAQLVGAKQDSPASPTTREPRPRPKQK